MFFPISKSDLDIKINSKDKKYQTILKYAISSFTTHFLLIENDKVLISIKPKKDSIIPKKLIETFSITKSIIGIAFILLIQNRKLNSINQKVSEFIKEWKYDNRRNISIKQVLLHTSNLANNWNFHKFSDIDKYGKKTRKYKMNVKELSKQITLKTNNLKKWDYNNTATQTLITLFEIISGEDIEKYLDRYIFKPLKIRYKWKRDIYNNCFGPFGFESNINGLYKIGKLLLNNGKWNGKIILDSKLIDFMFYPYVDYKDMGTFGKNKENYGLMWYNINNEHFSAHGYLGNKLIVNKKKKIICVRLIQQEWDNKLFRSEIKKYKIHFHNLTKLIYNL
jgi:CubicO group peptidase (beta-lactamase class C family)